MTALALEPHPQTLWPLAWLQSAESSGSAQAFGVLSIEFPGATSHYSTSDFNDVDFGPIFGRVVSWPLLHLGFEPGSFGLSLPQGIVELQDPDQSIAAIFEGASGQGVYRVAATVRAGLAALPSPSWPVMWTGVVASWASKPSVIRLVLSHDEAWLRAPLCRHRVNPTDWPYAHESAYVRVDGERRGRPLPLAVGTFDSRRAPVELPGALPTLYLDTRTSEWRFVPILGAAKEVPRVWIGGVLDYSDFAMRTAKWKQAGEGTDYEIEIDTISGYDVTVIRWQIDPKDTIDAAADDLIPVVRCDLTGHETVGDGTGAAIEGPLAGLRHLLLLGWSSWRSGAYPDRTTGPLDLETWAEVDDYLSGNLRRPRNAAPWTSGRKPHLYVGDGRRAVEVLNDACLELGIRPYWTESGKVGLAVVDHRRKRTFFEAEHWIRDEDASSRIRTNPSRQRLRSKLEAGAISVKDVYVGWDAEERLRALLSGGEVGTFDLVPYVTTQDSGFTTTGGGDPHDEVLDPPYAPDDDVTVASWDAASATGTFRVRVAWREGGPQIPQGHAVVAVEIGHRSRYVANGGGAHTAKAGVWIGGAATYGPQGDITLTTDWTDYREVFLLNPDSGDPWTLEDIGPDLLQLIFSATHVASQDEIEVTSLFARVYTADGGPAAGLIRERLAAELLLSRRPVKVVQAIVGLHRAGIRPGDYFSVSTTNVAAGTLVAGQAQGWGTEPWQRRLHVMCSRAVDWNRNEARILGLDARDLLVPWWETGQALTGAPVAGHIVRLGAWRAGRAGQPDGREFSRPTDDSGTPTGVDTITGPNGETVTLAADHERYTDAGLVLEPAAGGVSADSLVIRSCHDAQAWDAEGGGCAVFLVTCPTLGAAQFCLMLCGSDKLFFTVSGTARLRFTRTTGGTTYTAEINTTTLSPGSPVAIAIRWTPGIGGQERLDVDEFVEPVPPYTLDLWARQDGIALRAASVVSAEGYNGDFYLLNAAGSEQFVSAFQTGRVWRQLLSEAEIEAEMQALIP